MVRLDEAVAFVRKKDADELLAIRDNLDRFLSRPNLPPDLLADTFYFKGVVESELHLRRLGPHTPLAQVIDDHPSPQGRGAAT